MCKKTSFLFKLLLTCTIVVSIVTKSVSALTWDGASSSGSSGSGNVTGGDYAYSYSESAKAIGYRFSVVNAAGGVQKGPVDVFRYATSTTDINRAKLSVKYAKTILKNIYSITSFETTNSKTNCYFDTDLGLALPELTTGIETWSTKTNMNTLFSSVGWEINVENCDSNSWSVLIEPIFAVTLAGEKCAFTVTEIAAYGASIYGEDNYVSSVGSGSSWGNISYYTNRDWPNALRAENGFGLFTAAPKLTTYKTPFKTLITHGYGVAILYGENIVNGTPPEITKWTYEQNGVNGFTIYIRTENADTLQVPVWTVNNNQDDLIWYVDSVIKENNTINEITYNWKVYIPFSNHNGEMGDYATHFYAYNANGSDVKGDIYTPPPYTVKYDSNGGAGTMASHQVVYNSVMNLSQNQFTRTGYIFKGWTAHRNSDNKWYVAGGWYTEEEINEKGLSKYIYPDQWSGSLDYSWSTSATETITFYAQWENTPPEFIFPDVGGSSISGDRISIPVGTYFDPLSYVIAKDDEDGDITDEITIIENNVPVDDDGKTNVIGKGYIVQYRIVDSGGLNTLFVLIVDVVPVESEDNENLANGSGFIRFINSRYLETLIENSKWRLEPLKNLLLSIFSNDLTDTSGCEQVWEFKAEDYDDVHDWCLTHDKGEQTNKEFINEFGNDEHRTKK